MGYVDHMMRFASYQQKGNDNLLVSQAIGGDTCLATVIDMKYSLISLYLHYTGIV